MDDFGKETNEASLDRQAQGMSWPKEQFTWFPFKNNYT